MTQQRLEDAVMDGVDRVDEVDPIDLIDEPNSNEPNSNEPNSDEPNSDEPFTGAEPGEPFDKPITLQDLTNRMIELHREKRDLKTRAENNSAEIKLLEPVISKRFAAQQIQQQKTMTGTASGCGNAARRPGTTTRMNMAGAADGAVIAPPRRRPRDWRPPPYSTSSETPYSSGCTTSPTSFRPTRN